MADTGLGYSFQPNAAEFFRKRLNQQSYGGPMANEALRILSLRLPTNITGGRPISPEDLLRPRVGGTPTGVINPASLGSGGGLLDLIQQALGAGGGASVPGPVLTPGGGSGNQTRYVPPDVSTSPGAPQQPPFEGGRGPFSRGPSAF